MMLLVAAPILTLFESTMNLMSKTGHYNKARRYVLTVVDIIYVLQGKTRYFSDSAHADSGTVLVVSVQTGLRAILFIMNKDRMMRSRWAIEGLRSRTIGP